MSSGPPASCGIPAGLVDERLPIGGVSDESTEADSGAEEVTPAPNLPASDGAAVGRVDNQKSTSPASSGGCPPTAAWWQLIWCHERCHKQDCDEKRTTITEAARETGASLLCLKKAAKYGVWLEQAQRPPYGLLTDWREVKPCLQAAALHPPRNRPAFTMIFCELPKHYERASAWVESLPPRPDPVHISTDIGLLKERMAGLVSELMSSSALRLRLHTRLGPPGTFSAARSAPLAVTQATQATGYGAAAWADDEEAELEKEYEVIRRQRDSMFLTSAQMPQVVPCLVATQVPDWSVAVRPAVTVTGMEHWAAMPQSPVVASQIMGASPGCDLPALAVAAVTGEQVPHVESPESPQFIEAMLMRAMPDHYDD